MTTITGVLDKPALTRWHREQVARAAVEHADRLAADRLAGNEEAAVAFLLAIPTEGTNGREHGTRIHDALESVLCRQPVDVDPRDAPAIAGARAWLNEHHVRPLEIEGFLINEALGYGGTCDLVAEIGGETWMLDWKSSKSVAWANGRVFDEMRLQLVAYARAEFVARVGDPVRWRAGPSIVSSSWSKSPSSLHVVFIKTPPSRLSMAPSTAAAGPAAAMPVHDGRQP